MTMSESRKSVVLVTGSTDGVGRVVARTLAQRGMHVIVHGRSRERAEGLVHEIDAAGGTADCVIADLSSLQNVRSLAETVRHGHPHLHLLVNNAGIGSGGRSGGRETSVDGHELRFAVNYLSGFLLTRLLLSALTSAAPARIVNVSSIGQAPIDFSDVMLTKSYDGGRAYMQSKLAQVMFTIDLAQELEGTGVTVNALHPATYMNTTMVRQAGATPMSTVAEGAEAILHLATSPEVTAVNGQFFNGLRPSHANAQAYDENARRGLRRLSETLTGAPS